MKLFGSITELVSAIFRKDSQQITLRPNQTTTYTAARDVQLPPQDANSVIVSESASQTLTNKSIDADSNTITNIDNADIKASAGIDATKLGNGDVDNTELSLLSGLTTIMTPSSTDTLTNKTIDGDDNTLQDISLPSLKTVLADADKVIRRDASGVVISGNSLPNSSALVTIDSNSVLTNKDIDGGTASNARRITLPQDTLTNLQALTRKEGTLLYANDVDTVYYDNGTSLVPVGSGSGSGGINYVENPSAALNLDGWVASGAGVTVARTTTANELPREPLASAGIRITPVSGTTDYVRYRFQLGDADKSKLLQIQWAQKSLVGYTSGDLVVEMWTNTLSNYGGTYTQLTVSSSDVPAGDRVFAVTFTSTSADYYELRIRRASGTTAVVLQDVNVGPGEQSVVAAITDWQDISSSFSSGGGIGTISNKEIYGRQVGDSLHIKGYFTAGTTTGAVAYLVLNDYTIDQSKLASGAAPSGDARTQLGYAAVILQGATTNIYSNDYAPLLTYDFGTPNQIYFSAAAGSDAFIKGTGTGVIGASGIGIVIDLVVPVVEFNSTNIVGSLGQSLVSQSGAGLVERAGQLKGTNTNDSAIAGNVGEYLFFSGSAVFIADNVYEDIATLTLSAGDWDVECIAFMNEGTAGVGIVECRLGIYAGGVYSPSPGVNEIAVRNTSVATFNYNTLVLPPVRVTSNGTDLFILGSTFSGTQVVRIASKMGGYTGTPGNYVVSMRARRVR
jgi:hypothetical protein